MEESLNGTIQGQEDNRKVCCSPLCDESTFLCIACSECLNSHDHEGTTTFLKWPLLQADIDALEAKQHPSHGKAKRLSSKMANCLNEIETISKTVEATVLGADDDADLKVVNRFVRKFRTHETSLTGEETSIALESIVAQNKANQVGPKSQMISTLSSNYELFVNSVNKLLENLDRKRNRILGNKEGKEEDLFSAELRELQIEESQRQENSAILQPTVPIQPTKNQTPPTQIQQKQYAGNSWQAQGVSLMHWPRFQIVASIRPGDEHLNLLVKILNVTIKKSGGKVFQSCLMGDHSASVAGRFYYDQQLKEGAVVELLDAKVHIYEGRMSVNMIRAHCISTSHYRIPYVNTTVNLSEMNWENFKQPKAHKENWANETRR